MFARLVRRMVLLKLGKMGIETLSLEIKHIEKKVQYLDSSGKTQTGTVSRDADIGVAEADRDPGIRVRILGPLIHIWLWELHITFDNVNLSFNYSVFKQGQN